MSGLKTLPNQPQWVENFQKSMKLGTPLSEVLKGQLDFLKSPVGSSFFNELSKSVHRSIPIKPTTASGIQALVNAINIQPIPQSTFDSINAIAKHHDQLFSQFKGLGEVLRLQSSTTTQIKSLQISLAKISGHITATAVRQKNWELIEDYEDLTGKAIEFSDNFTEDLSEAQKGEFGILIVLILDFINKHKTTVGNKVLQVWAVIEIIFSVPDYYTKLFPSPDPLLEEVRSIGVKQDTVNHYIQLITEQLKEVKEYRITNRTGEVKLKPKSKTLVLNCLPKGFEVHVIQVHHKWVLVRYFDPEDNSPQTGWILKKYLELAK